MNTQRAKRVSITLRHAAAEFWRHPSPWLIGGLLAVAVIIRILLGDWHTGDITVPVVALAVFPFVEWVIHTSVLHWRPRTVAGRTIDWRLARDHRRHHVAPRDLPLIFIPWQTLLWVIPGLVAIAVFAFPRIGLGLTYLVTVGAIGMVYEWTHYLIHTDYRPKTRLYRALWNNHRHHHFKNEHYWFTITTAGTADRVLGTHPAPADVATSPTACDLHNLGAGI